MKQILASVLVVLALLVAIVIYSAKGFVSLDFWMMFLIAALLTSPLIWKILRIWNSKNKTIATIDILIKVWAVIFSLSLMLRMTLPKTFYQLEGEYCCTGQEGECLMVLAPCDIRMGWAGVLVLTFFVHIVQLIIAKEIGKRID